MADAKVLAGHATPRGRYPHLKRAGDYVYVSGTSARRPDNTIAGATVDAMGTTSLDIRVQTRAVIETIGDMLAQAGGAPRGRPDHGEPVQERVVERPGAGRRGQAVTVLVVVRAGAWPGVIAAEPARVGRGEGEEQVAGEV